MVAPSSLLLLLSTALPLINALPTPPTALSTLIRRDADEALEKILKRTGGMKALRLAARGFRGVPMACAFAELMFGENNLLRTEEAYEETRTRHWSQTAALEPGCIVTPNRAAEVQLALNIARLTATQFAVRSGGHNASPGFANINQHGFLISTERLTEVTYDKDTESVVVGVGNRWGRVYNELDKFNVTVVGGRVPDVGVGGLILGGGLSYLSNKHGLAADNVLNFELVLPNGKLVNANKNHNADLFWALKGGANNFGIVVRYTLRAIPMGPVWAGVLYYPGSQNKAVLDAYAHYQSCGQQDANSGLLLQITSDPVVGTFVNLFYDKPVMNPQVFEPFFKIPFLASTTQITRYADFLASQAQNYFIPRWQLRGTSYRADPGADQATLVAAQEGFADLNRLNGAYILIYQPVSESLIDQGRKNGGNPLGIRRESQTWFSTAVGWMDAKNDEAIYAMSKDVQRRLEDYTKPRNLFLDYVFMNDAFKDQNPIETYGRRNIRRLRRVLRKYDPRLVLRRLLPGGFKIPLEDDNGCKCDYKGKY